MSPGEEIEGEGVKTNRHPAPADPVLGRRPKRFSRRLRVCDSLPSGFDGFSYAPVIHEHGEQVGPLYLLA